MPTKQIQKKSKNLQQPKSSSKNITNKILQTQIKALVNMNKFSESLENRLLQLYDHAFPKICHSCKHTYLTRKDYLQMTSTLSKEHVIIKDGQVHEYRNCICGSTLFIVTHDRRDNSEIGKMKRKLFNECFNKLKKISSKKNHELKEIVRKIFHDTIYQTKVVEKLEDRS